jgi:hypothetical protein
MTEDHNRLTKSFVYNCLNGLLRRKNQIAIARKHGSEQSRLLGSTRETEGGV